MKMSDLIDRAQAMNAVADIRNILEHMDTVTDNEINMVKRAVERILAGLPTVDAVPVVHGYWIDTGKSDDAGNSFYMCSVCGCGDYHYPIVEVPYCWKCGARMDGNRKDDDSN